MTAAELRAATALMRERASAARDVTGASDWFPILGGELHTGDYWVKSSGGRVCLGAAEEEAVHIASWHPVVALAVADWLDRVLQDVTLDNYDLDEHDSALAVARAYMGSEQA